MMSSVEGDLALYNGNREALVMIEDFARSVSRRPRRSGAPGGIAIWYITSKGADPDPLAPVPFPRATGKVEKVCARIARKIMAARGRGDLRPRWQEDELAAAQIAAVCGRWETDSVHYGFTRNDAHASCFHQAIS